MRKQAAIAVAMLAMARLCSSTMITMGQPLASWLPGQHDDNPAMPGLPLSPPPPPQDKSYQTDSRLQEFPLHQEHETPVPALTAPETEAPVPTPPHQQRLQPSPQAVSSSPSAALRAINNTATTRTTMLVFGDSMVDPGNNNQLQTAAKANFLPYGMSFNGGNPTGRFCNGRLITDILAEKLGIGSIPGFHDQKLKPEQLITGVSFASAGSGYDDATAQKSESPAARPLLA